MQKVVIVNLNGIAYHLEEAAYAALRSYLDRAEAQLRDNLDRGEIVADLEQAIADKFGRYLGANKNVITGIEVSTIIDEMGPVHDDTTAAAHAGTDSADAASTAAGASTDSSEPGTSRSAKSTQDGFTPPSATRRLYRLLDSGVIGGVCSGLAVFFDVDVTLVRIAMALLALLEIVFLHTPVIVIGYLLAMFVIPAADTSEERAAARGIPFSAQQLIDEAKRNLGRIGEHDWKHTRREWQQQRRWERKYVRQMKRGYTWPPTSRWSPAMAPVTYGSQVVAGFLTPMLTLVSVAAFWAMVYAVVSLASTGAVHGWTLPGNVPLWLALVALLFLYNALMWPLHAARRASYFRLGGPDYGRYEAFDGLMSTLLGLAVVWAAYRYNPEIREWLRHLPEAWANVVASFKS